MPKVIFNLDIKKDARNYWDCANSDIMWGHDFTKCLKPEILTKLKGKPWEKVEGYITNLLKK